MFQYFTQIQLYRLYDRLIWERWNSNIAPYTRLPNDHFLEPNDPASDLIAYETEQIANLNDALSHMRHIIVDSIWLKDNPKEPSRGAWG